ncbi:hypothetical protein J6590_061592 [Homalodisca vitripennis]|nr:hypothetical protein J6590_061592 [Homalodisca vitripennis]
MCVILVVVAPGPRTHNLLAVLSPNPVTPPPHHHHVGRFVIVPISAQVMTSPEHEHPIDPVVRSEKSNESITETDMKNEEVVLIESRTNCALTMVLVGKSKIDPLQSLNFSLTCHVKKYGKGKCLTGESRTQERKCGEAKTCEINRHTVLVRWYQAVIRRWAKATA